MSNEFSRLPAPSDGENLTGYLIRFCEEVKDEFRCDVAHRDVEGRLEAHIRARIVECHVRGFWQPTRNGGVPVADCSQPYLAVACRLMPSGDVRVGEPITVHMLKEGEFTAWRHPAFPLPSPSTQFDQLARMLSDHGATLAFTPMEDGPGYSAVVRFPDGGTAHTDGSRGDLLAAVIGAVECHVGVDDEPETEFERAAVNVARDDVARGDVMSLDDAKVSLVGGEE